MELPRSVQGHHVGRLAPVAFAARGDALLRQGKGVGPFAVQLEDGGVVPLRHGLCSCPEDIHHCESQQEEGFRSPVCQVGFHRILLFCFELLAMCDTYGGTDIVDACLVVDSTFCT